MDTWIAEWLLSIGDEKNARTMLHEAISKDSDTHLRFGLPGTLLVAELWSADLPLP